MESQDDIEKLNSELQKSREEVKTLNEKLKSCEEKFDFNERLLHSLVEAAAGKIGQDFFDNIVIRLSEWLDAECVLIGKIVDHEKIQAVPLYLDGKILTDFSYELIGTPCEITTRKGYCEYPENAQQLFPKDQILIDINGESYIGTALYNKAGVITGVICAVSRKKLVIPPYAKEILKIIGARVSAEIERIDSEQALILSEAELRASNATKDKLFSIIAHDLRNPFNTILGFSDLLLNYNDKYEFSKQRKFLEIINQTSRNAYSLLENLLVWALAQRKLLSLNPEKLQLRSMSSESLKLLFSMAREKDISLINNISEDVFVTADKQMLSAIIRNLVSNAIKFTPNGGTVSISTKNSVSDNKIEVIVEDTGVGMTPEDISKIFSIDKHYSQDGTNLEKGTGLGLIICKDFVERNGGEINVTSEKDKGSKFVFTLYS